LAYVIYNITEVDSDDVSITIQLISDDECAEEVIVAHEQREKADAEGLLEDHGVGEAGPAYHWVRMITELWVRYQINTE
jgi:hypothetical protein